MSWRAESPPSLIQISRTRNSAPRVQQLLFFRRQRERGRPTLSGRPTPRARVLKTLRLEDELHPQLRSASVVELVRGVLGIDRAEGAARRTYDRARKQRMVEGIQELHPELDLHLLFQVYVFFQTQ